MSSRARDVFAAREAQGVPVRGIQDPVGSNTVGSQVPSTFKCEHLSGPVSAGHTSRFLLCRVRELAPPYHLGTTRTLDGTGPIRDLRPAPFGADAARTPAGPSTLRIVSPHVRTPTAQCLPLDSSTDISRRRRRSAPTTRWSRPVCMRPLAAKPYSSPRSESRMADSIDSASS